MAIASWRTAGGGKPRVEAALSWNLGLYPLSNANQRFSPGSRAQIVGYGSADPQEMAEYQEMRSTGYSMLGHASGPNPKSATEHGSSPQNRAQTGMRENAGHRKTAEYQERQPIGHPAAGHTPDPKPKSRLKHESSPAKPAARAYRTRGNGGIPTDEARRPFRGRTCIRTESEIGNRTWIQSAEQGTNRYARECRT